MAVPQPSHTTFRVLSLDGGGIRGAFSAACLAKLESSVDRPITDYFDLITGTSTGGIIALALGLGISTETIRDMYARNGARIFTRRQQQRLLLKARLGLWIAKQGGSLSDSLDVNSLVPVTIHERRPSRYLSRSLPRPDPGNGHNDSPSHSSNRSHQRIDCYLQDTTPAELRTRPALSSC